MILEMVWTNLLTGIGIDPNRLLFILIENFLVVGCGKRGAKVRAASGSWNDPAFNYVFDGVVYAVCVSLGFSGLENVVYIKRFGMDVALIRGLAAVPLHASAACSWDISMAWRKPIQVRGMVN